MTNEGKLPFKILIVEDDEDACSNMVDILSLDGYEIVTANHCLHAINFLKSDRFGAVVVDWKLPDGSGADLLPVIFQHERDTPVIIVTGLREFDVAVTALREGAYDFLLKPINADALRSVLKRVVERKSYKDEIARAQEKLVQNERLAAIGQMMAGLAHESRNVFQKSHACLTNLSFDVRDMPESLALVNKVQNALDHLNSLLDEVRDYAAPILLEKSATHIPALIHETWAQLTEANPESRSISLQLMQPDGMPDTLLADRYRLGQVVWNLLENARMACHPSEGEVTIQFSVTHDSQQLVIQFSDNGCGIADEHVEQIFQPFFTTKIKGTGLGLAICRRIIEAHGGTLNLDRDSNHATNFVMRLPLVS